MEIGPHFFEKSGRQTHTETDAAASYIYIDERNVGNAEIYVFIHNCLCGCASRYAYAICLLLTKYVV